MKKINVLLKRYAVALTLLSVTAIIIHSCKKDRSASNSAEASITEIKNWFAIQPQSKQLSSAIFRKNIESKNIPAGADVNLIPDWANAKAYNTAGTDVIEVPVLCDGVFFV